MRSKVASISASFSLGGLIEKYKPFLRISSSSGLNLWDDRLVTVSLWLNGSVLFLVRAFNFLRWFLSSFSIFLSTFLVRAFFNIYQSTEFRMLANSVDFLLRSFSSFLFSLDRLLMAERKSRFHMAFTSWCATFGNGNTRTWEIRQTTDNLAKSLTSRSAFRFFVDNFSSALRSDKESFPSYFCAKS